MVNAFAWLRNVLALIGVLALGFWLGSGHAVRAASSESGQGVQFQLTSGVEPSSALLVYSPDAKTVYLYQGAMQGNSNLQCNYKFQMDRPGGVIRRLSCDAQSVFP